MFGAFLRAVAVDELRSAAPCVAIEDNEEGSIVGCSIAKDGYSIGDGLPNMDGAIGWYSILDSAAAFTY